MLATGAERNQMENTHLDCPLVVNFRGMNPATRADSYHEEFNDERTGQHTA